MYCPSCATPNAEDTKFCRSCGANLSLVPQALTGQLPDARSRRRRHEKRSREVEAPPSIAEGITKLFMGVGFILVSCGVLFFAPAGRIWWFWMLIPAFGLLGKGVAEIVSAKYGPNLTQGPTQKAVHSVAPTGELPQRNEVHLPPPSVTENTTRQLDPKTDPYRYRESERH